MGNAPYMYWVGMNTQPDTSASDLADFSDFYSDTHVKEVLAANPGFIRATRYELQEQDARGDFGPRWLAVYEMDSQAAADLYVKRNDGPPEGRPTYTPGPAAWQQYQGWWRLLWHRRVPDTGELGAAGAPYLFMVGMDVPAGTSQQGLQEFNDFYTNIHVPEVVSVSKFLRGTRYELYRDFRHPEPGSPQFLAVYEGDKGSLEARSKRAAEPRSAAPLSSGPPVWEAHATAWRLLYRLVDSHARQDVG
jgi:hypothetical protein